jgi:hypothetical protein
MAAHEMAFAHTPVERHFFAADWFGIRTTRVKGASGGWIDGSGNVSLQDDAVNPEVRIRNGDCRYQSFGIGMLGFCKQLL